MAVLYGGLHKRERERWRPVVAAGAAYCAEPVCLMDTRWIQPDTPWDLAHDRTTRRYHGPAHRRCNRSEGATYRLQRASVVRRWVL